MATNILEQFKKFISGIKDDQSQNQTETIASLPNVANVMAALPNPDPILKKAGKDIQVYRDLLGDDEVWSAWQSFKSGVKSLEWEIFGDETKDDRIDLINELFKGYKMHSLIDQILDARGYGFQPIEITWQTNNGQWLPIKLTPKPPEWFTFNTAGKLCIKAEYNAINHIVEPVPELAFITVAHGASYANPWGQAVFSRVFWPAVFKKGGIKFWVTFMEKYGMPWVTGALPRNASAPEKSELLKQLDAMVQDAVAVIPDDSSVTVHPTGSTANSEMHNTFVGFCIQQINKVLLSQTLTGTSGNGAGSYALGKVHGEIREDVIGEGKRLVEEVLNQIITWIYRFNFGEKPALQFRLYEEGDVDKDLAERDNVLTQAGVRFSKTYFKKTYGLEDEDFEVVDPYPMGAPEFSQRTKPAPKPCSCGCGGDPTIHFEQELQNGRVTAQDEVDKLIDNLGGQALLNEALKPVLEAFNETGSPEELYEKLAETYPDLDTKALEEKLTQALFIAELLGRSEDASAN